MSTLRAGVGFVTASRVIRPSRVTVRVVLILQTWLWVYPPTRHSIRGPAMRKGGRFRENRVSVSWSASISIE